MGVVTILGHLFPGPDFAGKLTLTIAEMNIVRISAYLAFPCYLVWES